MNKEREVVVEKILSNMTDDEIRNAAKLGILFTLEFTVKVSNLLSEMIKGKK